MLMCFHNITKKQTGNKQIIELLFKLTSCYLYTLLGKINISPKNQELKIPACV